MTFLPGPGPTWAGTVKCARRAVRASLALLALLGPAAGAAEPGPARLVPALEGWLDAHSPYPARAEPPRILLVDPAEALVRDRHATRIGGRLRGLYDAEAATIILMRPWSAGDPRDASVLLHELAHHRQEVAKHWYCAAEQEWPAYKLQAAWLAELGLDAGFYWPAILLESSCTPRDIHPD